MMNIHRKLFKSALQIQANWIRVQSTKFKLDKLQSEIKIDHWTKTKIITVENGEQTMKFPVTWLRDNCQCPKCFHSGTTSRILDWQEANVVNSLPTEINANPSTNQINISWSDGHQSVFDFNWLEKRDFNESKQQNYLNNFYRPTKHTWGVKDFKTILKTFDFQKILKCDNTLKDWLEALTVYGVAIVNETPNTQYELRKLIERVGFIRKTHYGEEYIVAAKPGTTNVAYLSTPLQLHADLPYYEYMPGANFLHCIEQTESAGGFSLISDGFYAAEKLKLNYPELFDVLSTTLVDWSDVGEEDGNKFHSINRAPVICIGRDGRIERINHSIPQRDSHFNIPIDIVETWYEALDVFIRILHDEKVTFKLNPGEIITFDNTRSIHGRTGFTDTDSNTRFLVGAYLDWDEIYSKLRVLKTKIENNKK